MMSDPEKQKEITKEIHSVAFTDNDGWASVAGYVKQQVRERGLEDFKVFFATFSFIMLVYSEIIRIFAY